MTTTTSVVDHIVLFKVRDNTDPSDAAAMVSRLNSLAALDVVSHLAAAPILRHRSAAAASFTLVLHSRYSSKTDLADYAVHPAHLAVVQANHPFCDDVMAVDWIADLGGATAALPPGAAVRVTLAKPKEGVAVAEVIEVLARAEESLGVREVSFGENFSPERAKGYAVGFLKVFGGVEELEEFDGALVKMVEEKAHPLLDSVLVFDFVVSSIPIEGS